MSDYECDWCGTVFTSKKEFIAHLEEERQQADGEVADLSCFIYDIDEQL